MTVASRWCGGNFTRIETFADNRPNAPPSVIACRSRLAVRVADCRPTARPTPAAGVDVLKYRGLEQISELALTEAIARAPIDQFVIWTGVEAQGADQSLRLRALRCIEEVDEPVPLRVLMRRAARLSAEGGLHPDLVRSAVRLHQGARPAAYLLCRRQACGAFVAVTDIPFPACRRGTIRAGQPVLDVRAGAGSPAIGETRLSS